jgi:protoporphyrinogen oxidase
LHVVVVGAGASGLAAGYALQQRNNSDLTYQVFEAEADAGGVCRTFRSGPFTFDRVSHALHFRDPQMRDFVRSLLGNDLLEVNRRAFVRYKGRYIPYPYQMHLGYLPWSDLLAATSSFIGARLKRQATAANFRSWMEAEFGSKVCEQFMLPYNRKLWGVDPEEMSTDWMRFVPRTSAAQLLKSAFVPSRQAGYNANFLYPAAGGISALFSAFGERVPGLQTGKAVSEFRVREKKVVFSDGSDSSYDRLITTIPLPELARLTPEMPEKIREAIMGLRNTSLLSVIFCIDRPAALPFHWVYFAEKQFPFFRLYFTSNVNPAHAPPGGSIVAAEISNPAAGERESLIESSMEALLRLGIVDNRDQIASVNAFDLRYAYPVPTLDRLERLKFIFDWLKQMDVRSIGRFGSWSYSSIEDCILQGFSTVSEL